MEIYEDKIFDDFVQGRLNAFYRSCYPAVLTYAARLLDGEQAFLAEDCAQNAIYHAYENRHRLHSFRALMAYIYTSIHHEMVSMARHRQAQENYMEKLQQEPEPLPDLTDALVEQETLDLLFAAIARLPQRLQRIFELSFEQGLKNAEVAQLLGVSESAVKKQKTQLIDTLRTNLRGRIDEATLMIFMAWWQG